MDAKMAYQKLPAFMFYPGDWLKDPELRRCSRFARGLLVDLLCLMWEAKSRGCLEFDGVAWSDADVVRAVGGDYEETEEALKELVSNGVLKRNSFGAIHSSRMVREESIRQMRAQAGSKGGSKTQATRQAKDKQNTEYEDEDEDKSSLGEKECREKGGTGFDRFWEAWPAHHRKSDKARCQARWKSAALEPLTDRIVAAIEEWKQSAEWTKDGGQFISAPLVFLNKKKWEGATPPPASAVLSFEDELERDKKRTLEKLRSVQ